MHEILGQYPVMAFVQVCDNNGSNFSEPSKREYPLEQQSY
jgi:hypothetical protein